MVILNTFMEMILWRGAWNFRVKSPTSSSLLAYENYVKMWPRQVLGVNKHSSSVEMFIVTTEHCESVMKNCFPSTMKNDWYRVTSVSTITTHCLDNRLLGRWRLTAERWEKPFFIINAPHHLVFTVLAEKSNFT